MVFMDIVQDGLFITLNCHKGSKDGEFFRLVIDAETKQVVERPDKPDIDASAAYSHIYSMMKSGTGCLPIRLRPGDKPEKILDRLGKGGDDKWTGIHFPEN
jgi:hypothetical protein